MTSVRTISKRTRTVCLNFVRYYPILMQVIMLCSIFDEYYSTSITNYLYPVLGHSLAWDVFLLAFLKMFRFCSWHRVLIWSMILNITIEWITVNIQIPVEANIVTHIALVITIVAILVSMFLRFKTGCFEPKEEDVYEYKTPQNKEGGLS